MVPPVALSTVDEPEQIDTLGPALMVGKGLTVTVTLEVFTQPLASVPVTV